MKIVYSIVLYLFGALFCSNLAYSDTRYRIRDGSVSITDAADVTGCEVSCTGAWTVWSEEPYQNLASKYHVEADYSDGNGNLRLGVIMTNDMDITMHTAGRLTFKYGGYTQMEVWLDGTLMEYVNLYPGYVYQVRSQMYDWHTYSINVSGFSEHKVKLRMWGCEYESDPYRMFLQIDGVSFKGRWPIRYEGTKGMSNNNPTEYSSGDVIKFSSLDSPAGWRFVGWSPSSIQSGASGAQVVTAQWEPLQYAIDIDGTAGESYVYGQQVTLSTFTEKTMGGTNIVCRGWTGTGDIPSAGVTTQVTFMVTQPSSLHWIYETNYWFEAQASSGGTVSVDKAGYLAQTAGSWVPSGTNVVLVATPDEHWHFTGWTESGTGNLLSSATRQQFVINNPLDVQANFAVDTYIVTFDLGEHGTKDSGTLSQSVAHGMSAVAPSVKPNAGYRFVGWDKTFSSIMAGITITAQYEPIAYTLTYMDVQGCANSNPKTYTIEDAVTFSPPSGRVGWQFLGWNPSGIALGTTGDKTVQATWAANAYSVSFDANGGTGSMAALPMTYDTESEITSNGFVRTGYVFVGWSTSENGAVEYQNGVAVSNLTSVHNGTVTLYAIWEQLVVPAPSITPVDGATFSTDSCLVSLDCAMEGVSIYFTTNGATPKTSASYLYTQPFTVYGTVNIKAVAVKDTVKSSYATATITKVDPVPVETPVITPVDGSTFSTETCVVTITCPTDGAAIYYTTDGTTPKTTATYRYTGPFVITGTSTIKAVATKEGWLKSAYGTATISKVSLSLEGVLGVDSRVSVTTGGAADWVPINDVSSKDGGTCARSGLGHGDDEAESWIQLSVNGKGTLSFWCKTSCEHDDDGAFTWDRLEVIVDGVAKDDWRMDGVSEWMQRTVVFETQGTHAVKVVYIKDVSDYDGEDCVWIDDVTWSGESAEEPLPLLGNPAIDPADGETFATDTCTVTITCATPNAVIYYSTNGQTPGTTEDCRYTGPFTISKTTTVKAVAVRGEEKSAYVSVTLTKVDPTYADASVGKDVTGLDTPVVVPATWVTESLSQRFGAGKEASFRQLYGNDLAGALAKPTGKIGQKGEPLTVWDDYVAGTDPTDPKSVFTMFIEIVDGNIVVNWSPNLNEGTTNRLYRLKSKANLSDVWSCPPVEGHRFFTVEVGLPDGVTATKEPGVIGKVSKSESNELYCVIDLSGGTEANVYPISYLSAEPTGGWTDEYKTTKLVLRRIEPGTFMMGGEYEVTLTKPFYMGVFEVTQRQWELVMGTRPAYFSNDDYYASRPVEEVSYNMIRGSLAGAGWPSSSAVDDSSFLGVLRAKTGVGFDLPTEAQWEYACRAGTTTHYNSGKNYSNSGQDTNMDEVGRYAYNGGSQYSSSCGVSAGSAKVGSYLPNEWGLYDMHGNVWEWCLDRWFGSLSVATDPIGPGSGSNRVLRGGSWYSYASRCASSCRDYNALSSENYGSGFRLYRPLQETK